MSDAFLVGEASHRSDRLAVVSDDQNYLIYGLIDPRDRLVHYVGLSTVGLRRPRAHGRKSDKINDLKLAWIAEMKAVSLTFEIAILAPSTKETIKADERWWISYGFLSGWPLTNLTHGGEGGAHHPITVERLRSNAKRQMESPEQREVRRRSMLARQTPEWLAFLSATQRARYPEGYVTKQARRDAERAARKGLPRERRQVSDSAKAKLSALARKRQADPAVKAQIGARTRALFADPVKRAALVERNRTMWTPELRARVAEKARLRQADPEVRRTISERVKAYRARKRSA